MPESFQLKNQRGSILAGVLALTMAMTAIAGGYILMSGNTAGRRLDSIDDLRLHNAAEAGALLGMRWLKEYEAKYYGEAPPVWDTEVPITPADYEIDNIKVQVKAVHTPAGPGIFQINSRAISLDQKETLVITWAINSADDLSAADQATKGYKSTNATDRWVETYLPGNP
jgi:hypothetical protein